jgi:hypothetical protein
MNLYSNSKPRFHVLTGTSTDADQYLAKLRFEAGPKIAIRLLRGRNMESMEGLYNELAAALQFPLYFGRNWGALDECLADLEWLPADAYLLFFADAPSVLKLTGDEDGDAFFRLLFRICNDWADRSYLGGGLERKARPFHVVLHAGVAEAGQFLHRVEAAIGDPVSKIAGSEER